MYPGTRTARTTGTSVRRPSSMAVRAGYAGRLPTSEDDISDHPLRRALARVRLPVFTGRTRFLALPGGVVLAGLGVSSMLWADLGIGPYDLFIDGVAHQLGTTFGVASVLLSAAFVLTGWLLGGPVGPATLVLVLVLGPVIDVWGALYPAAPDALAPRVLALVAGVTVTAFGISTVIATRFGAGPVEVLMLALTRHGWPVARVRTLMEIAMFAAGWLLGGAVGLGTAFVAVVIGHLFAAFLPHEVRGDTGPPADQSALQQG